MPKHADGKVVYTVADLVERWEAALDKVLTDHEARIRALERQRALRNMVVTVLTAVLSTLTTIFGIGGCGAARTRYVVNGEATPAEWTRLRQSTVKVMVDGDFHGTGWYVTPDTVVTAGHVCPSEEEDGIVTVEGPSTPESGLLALALIRVDDRYAPADDYCLLYVLGGQGVPLVLRDTDASQWEKVHWYGYPAGWGVTSQGIVSGTRRGLTVIGGTTFYGASGSAVVGEDGKVVGLLVRGVMGGGVTMAVPVTNLRAGLDKGLAPLTARNEGDD